MPPFTFCQIDILFLCKAVLSAMKIDDFSLGLIGKAMISRREALKR
jgi:hypothetical protein